MIAGIMTRTSQNAQHGIKTQKKERKKASETANLTFPTAPTGFPTATANAATGERPKMICTYCKKEGHTEDRCFKKMSHNGITPN
jgi:hypothetical protein